MENKLERDNDNDDDLIHLLNIGELLNKCSIMITIIRKWSILLEAVRTIAHSLLINVDLILDMLIR